MYFTEYFSEPVDDRSRQVSRSPNPPPQTSTTQTPHPNSQTPNPKLLLQGRFVVWATENGHAYKDDVYFRCVCVRVCVCACVCVWLCVCLSACVFVCVFMHVSIHGRVFKPLCPPGASSGRAEKYALATLWRLKQILGTRSGSRVWTAAGRKGATCASRGRIEGLSRSRGETGPS